MLRYFSLEIKYGEKKGKLRRVNPEQKKTIKDPNPNDQEYIYNKVDEFHLSKDKIMLDPSQDYDESDEQESDEEVLAIDSEESEEEEINNADEALNDKKDDDSEDYSDVDNDDISDDDDDNEDDDDDDDDSNSEDGIPSSKAWGKSKKAYYDTDIHEEDLLSDEEAQEAAAEEEKEALLLQKQMAERLGSEDFYKCDVENIENDQSSDAVTESNVITDYSKLSKREKLEILSKQSPELLPLIEEYKDMLNELKSKYHPLLLMSQKGCIESKQVRLFVEMKHHILTNYCLNIAFYMALKSSKTFLKGHPVFNALVQHKELLSKLYPVEKDLASQIATLISQYQTGEWESISTVVEEVDDNSQELKKKKKEKKSKKLSKMKQSNASLDNIDPLEYYNMVKEQAENEKRLKLSKNQNDEPADKEDEELDEEAKRKITYEMSKNKGLIRKRRKELKNPRVKHRMKFKKAVIKHKGQVREVKKEINRYGGEITGIKSSLARSTKIR